MNELGNVKSPRHNHPTDDRVRVEAGKGTCDARFVIGTMRIVALLDVTIQPSQLLPSAQDVFLVE